MAPLDSGLMEVPYIPPPVRRGSLALSNSLIAHRDPLQISADGATAEIFFTSPTAPARSVYWVGAGVGAARAAVGLPPQVLRRLTRGIEVVGVDAEAAALFIEASLAKWLDSIENAHPGLALSLGGPTTLPDDALATDMHIRAAGIEHIVHLRLEAEAAKSLVDCINTASPMRPPEWFPLLATARLGSVEVDLQDLTDLVAGDAIALHKASRHDRAQLCIGQTPCAALRIGEKEGRFRAMIVGPIRFLQKDIGMTDEPNPEKPETATEAKTQTEAEPKPADDPALVERSVNDVSNLKVSLDFDLGSVPLTVADLDGLSDGQIFDLSLDPHGAVKITSGGRLIGHGEIVDLSGTLGVRVTRLMAGKS